jgi:hypothetical protein
MNLPKCKMKFSLVSFSSYKGKRFTLELSARTHARAHTHTHTYMQAQVFLNGEDERTPQFPKLINNYTADT